MHNDPTWKYYNVKAAVYNPSKAALNMYTIVLAYELRDTPFKVNAVDPGFTATDFNQHSGTGSLLIMLPGCQEEWVHAVPKTARPVGDRINWTFRPYVEAIFQGRGSANGHGEQKPA